MATDAVTRTLFTEHEGKKVELHPRTIAEQVIITDENGQASTLNEEFHELRESVQEIQEVDVDPVAAFEDELNKTKQPSN